MAAIRPNDWRAGAGRVEGDDDLRAQLVGVHVAGKAVEQVPHLGRGIEVDVQIVARDIDDELIQPIGRLLAGFQVQSLAVCFAMIADLLADLDGAYVERIGRVVGDESDMQGDSLDA